MPPLIKASSNCPGWLSPITSYRGSRKGVGDKMELSTKNEATVYYLEKNSDGTDNLTGAFIAVRLGTAKALREIEKRCTVTKKIKGVEVKDIDSEKYQEELWKYAIKNWGGITIEGKEYPCTDENKVFLMLNSVDFCAIVNSCLESEKLNKVDSWDVLKNS